ncbi:A/G-specific adenine glycosylase [Bacteroides sp. 214]|uniref:A/G-specific adenine glycosylase n=1 Tax=Bacteroides sp. 214 TaxID=2302935 RepID=UPI0013D440BF|nr:A/G-specific adenine glycosylase [Bacteroides sp. 214]NDW13445.1 A/G-specific adenine glycosylase [Bacteroides sp. 214]
MGKQINRSLFSTRVIEWYELNKRELPWRDVTTPYVIWISEIILQQTRVAQGYDYFVRFIERFPDLTTLAAAEEDEVLKYWQGLGYYSRARNLHAAAKKLKGVFPRTYSEVLAMKGVGEYTAAAICSFAYNMPYAVVDGNVYRVLARYLGVDVPIDSTQGKKIFAALADELMDKSRPATYNQAIMEFGALQCVPNSPDCGSCPMIDGCVAYASAAVAKLPVKQNKLKTKDRFFNYIYVRAGAYTFIHRRAANDIWKGLYELPLVETEVMLSADAFVASDAFYTLVNASEKPIVRLLSSGHKHVLSHQIIYANFYEVILPENARSFSAYKKIRRDEIDDYAVPRLIHNFLLSLE